MRSSRCPRKTERNSGSTIANTPSTVLTARSSASSAWRRTSPNTLTRKKGCTRARSSYERRRRIARLGAPCPGSSQRAHGALSDLLREILGVGPDDYVSLPGLMALIHPEDRAAIPGWLQRGGTLARGCPSNWNIASSANRIKVCVGSERSADIERDNRGNPVKLRGTVQDITERKQSSGSAAESRDLLRLFVEHAPVALAMFDREMRYLAVSRRWSICIHDLQDRELIGRSHYEFFSEISDELAGATSPRSGGRSHPSGEVNLARADGSLQWLRREIQPWFTADGAVGGIIIFSEDVTEHEASGSGAAPEQGTAASVCRARAGGAGHVRSRNALPGRQPALGQRPFR